jgi:hypothetical protein
MSHPLGRMLGKMFKPVLVRPPDDPYYKKFRLAVKKDGLTYRIDSSDGFIELSDGRCFPHYGDWHETLERYKDPRP